MWPSGARAHANGRLPVLLCLQRMRRTAQAEARRLLRILFLRLRAVSTNSAKSIVLSVRPGNDGREFTTHPPPGLMVRSAEGASRTMAAPPLETALRASSG